MWSQHTYPYTHTRFTCIWVSFHTHTHTHYYIGGGVASRRGAGGGGVGDGKISAAHETDAESCGRTAGPPLPTLQDEPINQSGLCAYNINNMRWSFAVTRFSEYPNGSVSRTLRRGTAPQPLSSEGCGGVYIVFVHNIIHYTRVYVLCPCVHYLGRGQNLVYAFDEDMSERKNTTGE